MADRVTTAAAAVPLDPAAGGAATLRVFLAITGFPVLAAAYRAVIGAAPDLRIAGVAEHRDRLAVDVSRLAADVARLAADVVVVDVPNSTRADCPSARTIEAIRAARPAAHILAIESACGRKRHVPATRAGADGLLPREATPGDVLAALRLLGRGEARSSSSISTDEPRADAALRRGIVRATEL